MLEKLKERFNTQKSDDTFVEAAINPVARRQYIGKLENSRTQMTRVLILWLLLFTSNFLMELLIPSSIPRTPNSQTITNIQLIGQGLIVVGLVAGSVSIDLSIKFLKALEAGAKQTE